MNLYSSLNHGSVLICVLLKYTLNVEGLFNLYIKSIKKACFSTAIYNAQYLRDMMRNKRLENSERKEEEKSVETICTAKHSITFILVSVNRIIMLTLVS